MQDVSLSSDFWDAVARGAERETPRLAVLTQKPAGAKNVLLLATDGSRDASGALQHGRVFARREDLSADFMTGGSVKPVILLDRFSVQTVGGRRCVFALSLRVSSDRLELPASTRFAPHGGLDESADDAGKATASRELGACSSAPPHADEAESRRSDTPAQEAEAPPPTQNAKARRGREQGKRGRFHVQTGGAVARQKRGILVNIKDLNSYSQDWMIRGRVADKTDLRLFANPRGESQVFAATIIDHLFEVVLGRCYVSPFVCKKGEIRGSFFGGVAAAWHPRLEVGRVYQFSRGTIDTANKKYNSLSHEYEIKFDDRAVIVEVDDDPSIPAQIFSPVKLATLTTDESLLGSVVDVIGFVTSFCATHSVLAREEVQRKEMTVVDDSSAAVTVTLWEQHATALKDSVLAERPLVAIKALRVSEYAGKVSLTSTSRSVLLVDPHGLEDADRLEAWWEAEGEKAHRARVDPSHSSVITDISTVNKRTQELTAGALYFNCLAVIYDVHGDSPVWLWSLSLTLADLTGSLDCVALDECGQQVVGTLQVTPDTIQMLERGGTDTFGRTFADVMDLLRYREVRVRLCVRSYEFRGEARTTCKIVGCDWAEKDVEAQTSACLRSIRDQLE
ncbi:Replication protein A, 70 kDa DNA-binding subunit, related [Neospora caninum Liverpool]|uniref:Replication protein A, 70 kDa DNA-binding subunit, related n=1 Tax=Neospora caninum (strain Liverpool) TaxID=572307 RepID=F0VGL5_NEOCL|nr:Replication protein A, 70 kDa DNA-binding subunit, related [Neospora caninum Liverpool]CBZ52859.1 Replication protein A, 70 kDa DNA-binding subunit, related [Neospora caninum Liverpool]|eukprot:XP_003882891.1 Replication protein A, 70 kDa DNA-binding subunit, related [Neospora caninum Liverpool]